MGGAELARAEERSIECVVQQRTVSCVGRRISIVELDEAGLTLTRDGRRRLERERVETAHRWHRCLPRPERRWQRPSGAEAGERMTFDIRKRVEVRTQPAFT